MLRIEGIGIASQSIDCGFSPLPIELVSFTAESEPHDVHLQWSTASETNSDLFEVQRSEDGENFHRILSMPAAGHSTTAKNYAAMDTEPLAGTSYYRLRKKDLDGQEDRSPVLAVNRKTEERSVRVFPQSQFG